MKARALGGSISLAVVMAQVVALASATSAANAAEQSTIYTCRDRNGRTITSDRQIPECSDRSMRELGPSGVVKREIAAPLTPDQQRQKEIDDRKKRLADDVAREKKRRDMALLSAYSNETQIDNARHRALADAEDSIKISHRRLADLNSEKKALAQEAEFYKSKRMPPLVRRKVDDNQAAISDEEATVKMRQSDVERINQRYDEELKRYRELSDSGRGASR